MNGPSLPDYVVDCVEVRSGDTIVVEDRTGTRKRVSVHGIAAPEADQPYGPAATDLARSAVEGQRVEVDVTGTDRSGHVVARVRAGRKRLGPLLVRKGFAWHDRRRAPGATSLRALQQEARANGRGLWAQHHPVPTEKSRDRDAPLHTFAWRLVERARSFIRGFADEHTGRNEPVMGTD